MNIALLIIIIALLISVIVLLLIIIAAFLCCCCCCCGRLRGGVAWFGEDIIQFPIAIHKQQIPLREVAIQLPPQYLPCSCGIGSGSIGDSSGSSSTCPIALYQTIKLPQHEAQGPPKGVVGVVVDLVSNIGILLFQPLVWGGRCVQCVVCVCCVCRVYVVCVVGGWVNDAW